MIRVVGGCVCSDLVVRAGGLAPPIVLLGRFVGCVRWGLRRWMHLVGRRLGFPFDLHLAFRDAGCERFRVFFFSM